MKLSKKEKRIIITAAAGFAGLLLIWFLFIPAAIKVETAKVKRGHILSTVDAEGRTRVRNKFTVTAPVSGKMSRIDLNEGDSIPREFLITEIDPNPPLPRPPSELDNRPNPHTAHVYAPASGKILRIFDKSERFLQAGTPLLEIGSPNDIELVIDVLSSDAVQVRPKDLVLFEMAGTQETYKARVRTIEPQAVTKVSALGVEEKRVDIVADFLDDIPALGDNYRLDARIVIWEGNNVLSVPTSALFKIGEEWRVFVVKSGIARLQKVDVGHRSREETEILLGLDEGETVILHPPSSLSDGSRVTQE